MPTYTFRHKESKEERTEVMKIAERQEFLDQNPEWEQIFKAIAPSIGYNDLGVKKPSAGFREKLRKIAKDYPGSTVNSF